MTGVYNRYQGNTGHVERVSEPQEQPQAAPPPPQRPAPPGPGERRPPGPLSGLSGELSRLLGRLTRFSPETEDLILILLLYLLWRESGDEDFLFMLAGFLLF